MAKQKTSHNTFSKSEAIRFGWEIAKKNFWFFVALLIIPYGINWLFSLVSQPLLLTHNASLIVIGILVIIAGWIVQLETSFAMFAIFFTFVDKKKPALKDLFAYFDVGL